MDTVLSSLDELRKEYPDYVFLHEQLPIDEKIFNPDLGVIVNQAEDEMYVSLEGKDGKVGIEDIDPNFSSDDYSFINYQYINKQGSQESILSVSTNHGYQIQIGKVERGGGVMYQVKVNCIPTLHVDTGQVTYLLDPMIIKLWNLLRKVESHLKTNIPKYFEVQTSR